MSDLIYCTSFCNYGHAIATGRPVGHECYVIPPKLLIAERDDAADVANQWATWERTASRVVVRPED